MVSGETGVPVVSVLGVVEEENNISPGAVTLLLQLMGGNTAGENILSTKPVTLGHALSLTCQVNYNHNCIVCIIKKGYYKK